MWIATCAALLILLPQDTPSTKARPRAAREQPSAEKELKRKQAAFETKAPEEKELDDARRRSIGLLVGMQESLDPARKEPCEWPYEGVYRVPGESGKPEIPIGYRVGGTSIVCSALLRAQPEKLDKPSEAAIERSLAFVLEALQLPKMQPEGCKGYDVRGWGHIYALQLFLCLADADAVPPARRDEVAKKTEWLVDALCKSEIPQAGGWNYSRRAGYQSPRNPASTFMTAPALQALFHAKARGYEVDEGVVDRALAALERARSEPGAYGYGSPRTSQSEVPESKLSMMDKVGSSASRAALVETTLLLAGRGDAERHRRAIDWFFAHWDELAVRKSATGTHIPPYGIAPYYFLFGHVYCAQAIEMLPDGEDKDALRTKMRAFLARSIDYDGTWNDRQFERSAGYGTAMAVLALRMPDLPRPAPRASATKQPAEAKK